MKPVVYLLIASATLFLTACGVRVPDTNVVDSQSPLAMSPDYSGVMIPPNIAPLNFRIDVKGLDYVTVVEGEEKGRLVTGGETVRFDIKKWHALLDDNKGKKLNYSVYVKGDDNKWTRYRFSNEVSVDSIDSYFSYRLIEPSFVQYGALTINQRNLSNFDEAVIFSNAFPCDERRGFCINCHVPRNQFRDGRSQFHVRRFNGGTVIIEGDDVKKVNLKTDSTLSAGVYPAWHPELDLLAYSVNETHQRFFGNDRQKVEVIDGESGIILYDIKRNVVKKIIDDPDVLETFPAWSPDGRTLYYSAARYPDGVDAKTIDMKYDSVRYDILALRFNPDDMSFSGPDTIVHATSRDKSALLPRVSPDGKFLLYCEASQGTFHIWHKDSDLFMKSLVTGETIPLSRANSGDTDSYHSWASNSRWILFSSRRDDGSYTRPYIAHVSADGVDAKAFVVPQENPDYYLSLMKSFNVPEFLVEPVRVPREKILRAVTNEPVQATFEQ